MEQYTINNIDIEKNKELFEYEMTEVVLKLRGEFSVVSKEGTHYNKVAVEEQRLKVEPFSLPKVNCSISQINIPAVVVGNVKTSVFEDVRAPNLMVPTISYCVVDVPKHIEVKPLTSAKSLPYQISKIRGGDSPSIKKIKALYSENSEFAEFLFSSPNQESKAKVKTNVPRIPNINYGRLPPPPQLKGFRKNPTVPLFSTFYLPKLTFINNVSSLLQTIYFSKIKEEGCTLGANLVLNNNLPKLKHATTIDLPRIVNVSFSFSENKAVPINLPHIRSVVSHAAFPKITIRKTQLHRLTSIKKIDFVGGDVSSTSLNQKIVDYPNTSIGALCHNDVAITRVSLNKVFLPNLRIPQLPQTLTCIRTPNSITPSFDITTRILCENTIPSLTIKPHNIAYRVPMTDCTTYINDIVLSIR